MPRGYYPQNDPELDNDRSAFSDRIMMIALWLTENEGVVNGAENIQITFNCAGKTVNAELKTRHQIVERNSYTETEFRDLVKSLK